MMIHLHIDVRMSPRKIEGIMNKKFSWAKIMKTLRENNVFVTHIK
jgi:hypothetical protein